MKYYRLVLIGLFTFFCISLNAQFFVGGNFGLNTSGGSTDNGTTTTDNPSSFSFNLMPKIGKFLSEKVAVGAALNVTFSRNKTPGINEIISKTSTYGIMPFVRYYAIKMDKFSVFGQGNVGLSFSGSSTKVGGTSTDGPKTTRVYLTIIPGLAYDVNEKLSLETSLNILSFGYYNTTIKSGSDKTKNSSLNFGAGIDNVVSVGSLTIGAIYKF
jgi:opacity protein-like surface antigen